MVRPNGSVIGRNWSAELPLIHTCLVQGRPWRLSQPATTIYRVFERTGYPGSRQQNASNQRAISAGSDAIRTADIGTLPPACNQHLGCSTMRRKPISGPAVAVAAVVVGMAGSGTAM